MAHRAPLRILIASGTFHPEPGGPSTYLYHLIPTLQKRGHTVTALSFGDAPSEGYSYPLTRIRRRNYIVRYWQYYETAGRLWPGHDIAYLHSLGLPLPAAIRPRVAKIVGDVAWERAMNKGWIAPDTDIDAFQTSRHAIHVQLDKARRASEARDLAHIIVPSEYLRRMVLGWGVDPDRVSVIYNAVEEPNPAKRMDLCEARARLGLPDAPTLITAARLTAWKGIDHTLQALARLGDASIRLLIAGDGPYRDVLERLAADLGLAKQVVFLGRVSREKLSLYFQAADYKVLYSGYEGLSHVLLEALLVGTPVIASDKGGNPEIVHHDVNGLLVPYVDVSALTEAIGQALEAGRRTQLAAQTQVGLERFSWERLIEQTEAVLIQARESR